MKENRYLTESKMFLLLSLVRALFTYCFYYTTHQDSYQKSSQYANSQMHYILISVYRESWSNFAHKVPLKYGGLIYFLIAMQLDLLITHQVREIHFLRYIVPSSYSIRCEWYPLFFIHILCHPIDG